MYFYTYRIFKVYAIIKKNFTWNKTKSIFLLANFYSGQKR